MKQIDVLPDDVLLDVFDIYISMHPSNFLETKPSWQLLVHVCRRWRSLVLGSPRRLNLRLIVTPKARGKLDIWPALPLVVRVISSDTDNIIAALEQSNRVHEVFLHSVGWKMEEVFATMQVPFPELTDLIVLSFDETPPLIPDSFLDGSAPRLRILGLSGILFPGLSNLLLSATHLVNLYLDRIPHSEYISPEAMVASLSLLSSLEILTLKFKTAKYRPDGESRSLPPPKRPILPALELFRFRGVTEYLEVLVTFINASQLETLEIELLNQIDFDFPPLAQFINCSPKLRACHEARVGFYENSFLVKLRYETHEFGVYDSRDDDVYIDISCEGQDHQLPSIERVCNSYFLSTVEVLYIDRPYGWQADAVQSTQWLQLLLPFTAVKNLYIGESLGPGIMDALQEVVGGRIVEVLPSLQKMSVQWCEPSGRFRENIERFVTARRLSGQPVAVDVRKKPTW